MIAEVIINRSAKKLNRTFDYNIPKELEELILVGSKVLVPFGNSKNVVEAHVVALKETTTYEVKDIAKVQEDLDEKQIELAKWMAKRYFCNVSDCIRLMLAPGTSSKVKKVNDKTINCVYLKKDDDTMNFEIDTGKIKSEKHKKVLNFLKDNPGCTIPEIEVFTGCSRSIVKTLEKNGYVEIVEKKIERDPLINKNIEKTKKLNLTQEQEKAYNQVLRAINQEKYEQFLLYGVTGSRKNRSILTTNRKSTRKSKNSNGVSARNFVNTTNARQIYF